LVLVNTNKGLAIFEQVRKYLLYEPSNIDECRQRHLTVPAQASPNRNAFWNDFYAQGFEFVAKKYTDYGFINWVKHKVLKTMLHKIRICRK
jgi:hypothetical protein